MADSSRPAAATVPVPLQGIDDPAAAVAVQMFNVLGGVAILGTVLGFPFWANKVVTSVLLLVFAASAFGGRWLALRGRHTGAMHGFVAVVAALALPATALSVNPVAALLMMITPLPAYAVVCGRAYAFGAGALAILTAIAVQVAPLLGVNIPKILPTPPAAGTAGLVMAMAGILGPLVVVFDRLRETTAALRESMKELACLYAIRRDTQDAASPEELCRLSVQHLISAMQFPEIAVSVVELQGSRFASERWTEGMSHGLHAPIVLGAEPCGSVSVYYAEDRPFLLPQEQHLLCETAQLLATWLQRQRAELALAAEDQRLRGMAGLAADWYWRQDADFRFTAVAAGWGQAPGGQERPVDSQSLPSLGVRRWELPDATPLDGSWDEHRAVLEEHRLFRDFEFSFTRPDGSLQYVSASGQPLFDRDGLFTGYEGVARDVTARKRMEALMQILKIGVDQSLDGYAVADMQGMLTFLNDAFARMHGYAVEDLLGKSLSMLHTEEQLANEVLPALGQIAETGHFSGEINRLRKDGGVFPTLLTASVLRDRGGKPVAQFALTRDITERKRAEEERKNNEQLLRLFVEHAPAAIAMFDREMRYVVASHRYRTDYRLGERDLMGRSHYEVFPEMTEEQREVHRRCLAGAVMKREEDLLPRPDGSLDWVRYEIRPWYRHDEIGGIIFFSELITGKKQAEEALLRSHQRMTKVLNSIDAAIYIADMQTYELLFVNEFLERAFGQITGHVCWKTLQQKQDGPCPFCTNERLVTPDGQPAGVYQWEFQNSVNGRWYECRDTAIQWTDGRLVRMEVATDITERKRAEEQLLKLSMAVDQSPEHIMITDVNAVIEYVNPAFVTATGYAREEVIGQNPRMLKSGRTPRATYEEMWAALGGGRSWKGEFINRRKDGSEYVESAIIAPIRQPGGCITHYLAVKDDITEMKRIAEELMRYRLHLEDLVRSRTAELAEARERAEAANRAKSAFLASMSHEIRTPMNAVLGFSQLLLGEKGLSPAHRNNVEAIHRAGEHLLNVINDTLELSRIEAGRVHVNLAETDLGSLVWDLESMFRMKSEEKGLFLRIERGASLPRLIVTDEKKLRQILINLLGNALKFTRAGGITLRFRVGGDPGAGFTLIATVEDTGPGIAEEELARLFREFQQTRSGRDAGSGTGLGLAISRGFARLLDGDIAVESRVGEGSVFTLTLPVTIRDMVAVPLEMKGTRVAGLAKGETRRRILVADDVAANREVLRQMLGRVGFEVRTADDGIRAVELFSSWPPDLVLMDLRMPGMDGLEAIRTIRRNEMGSCVPIIVVTASAFEENRKEVTEAGGNDFVSKPFRESELLEIVRRYLGIQYILEAASELATEPREEARAPALSLPEDLRSALQAAVEKADLDRVIELVENLSTEDPRTASTLRELAEAFEYEELRTLLEASSPRGGRMGASDESERS